jgi:hypothetical protein
MPTNQPKILLRRNISLTGEDVDLIDKLQTALINEFGLKNLSQAEIVRKALNKLAKEILK